MIAYNFVYDNIPLSNFGLFICTFGGVGMETVTLGSEISFELGVVPGREKRNYITKNYQETLTTTFQVAKIDRKTKTAYELSQTEISYIMRWLNRKDGFHKFKLIQDEYEVLYTYANFNVNKIEIAKKIVGLELTMYTLYPYLLEEQSEITYSIPSSGLNILLTDNSDEVGYIYPNIKIECQSNGDFSFYNEYEDRTSIIKGCKKNEIITIDGNHLVINTSNPNHDIYDDFNFKFPRIVNSFSNRENNIRISGIECEISFNWSPIRKVGF